MIEIAFTSSFKRVFKKKLKGRKKIEKLFWDTVGVFTNDPFHPSLKNLWSYSVEYNLRVIFFFEDNNSKAIFVDIGTHNEVY